MEVAVGVGGTVVEGEGRGVLTEGGELRGEGGPEGLDFGLGGGGGGGGGGLDRGNDVGGGCFGSQDRRTRLYHIVWLCCSSPL